MSSSITIKGLDRLLKDIDKLPDKMIENIDKVTIGGALEIRAKAAAMAPSDEGNLRRSIVADVSRPLAKRVSVGAFYGPYMEFGTKKKVRIPAGYEQLAAQFKGRRGGTFKELLERMELWAKRNKITFGAKGKNKYKRAAFLIARKIAIVGVKPQPFFIPAIEAVSDKIRQRVASIIKNIKW